MDTIKRNKLKKRKASMFLYAKADLFKGDEEWKRREDQG
jgi:hypothetical protein